MKAPKRTLRACVIFAPIALSAVMLWQLRLKPLSFDSVRWRQAHNRGEFYGTRWRMRVDTLWRLQTGEIATANQADLLLGAVGPPPPCVRRYRLGSSLSGSWLLYVTFDAQGNIVREACAIRAD